MSIGAKRQCARARGQGSQEARGPRRASGGAAEGVRSGQEPTRGREGLVLCGVASAALASLSLPCFIGLASPRLRGLEGAAGGGGGGLGEEGGGAKAGGGGTRRRNGGDRRKVMMEEEEEREREGKQ